MNCGRGYAARLQSAYGAWYLETEGKGDEVAAAEGLAIAQETVVAVRDRVRGVHLNTPGGDVDRALEIFEALSDR